MQEVRRGRPLKKLAPDLKPEIRAWATRLREFYTILHMTLAELEQHLGVTPATLSRYLNGERLPEIAFLTSLDAAVANKTGAPLQPEVMLSVREQYYAACAVREPQRHQVYVLQDALRTAEDRVAEAEQTVWELRTELQLEQNLRAEAEASLRALREHAHRSVDTGAIRQELEAATAERDRLGELVQRHSAELTHALQTQQHIEQSRAQAKFALQRAQYDWEMELERRWAAAEAQSSGESESEQDDQSPSGGPLKSGWRGRFRQQPEPAHRSHRAERQRGARASEWPQPEGSLAADEPDAREIMNGLFANLSRRNQALVGLQLSLISELETREQDPDQLSSLFELDHLATRMRRNSDNLLALAGGRPDGQWTQPVDLVDVLRAAVSEVEEYERIYLSSFPTVQISGRAVNDLVHLLAELLENATKFSPSEAAVRVDGRSLDDGRALIEIHDSGPGLPPEGLLEINDRLASPPVLDGSVTRRMGLFMVGRLALGQDIRVQLRPSATGGTTALVMLPREGIEQHGWAAPTPTEP